MNYIAQCLKKFRALPDSIKNKIGGFEVLENIKKLEEQYGVELSFLVILVAIGEVNLDGISEYLEKKYNFSEEDAFDLRDDLTRDVFSFLLLDVEPSAAPFNDVREEFSKGLIELLTDPAEGEDMNFNIFSLFAKNGLLHEELSKILLDNQEKLTSGKIIIEDREVLPTVANWLKDFVKVNGSEMFDELKLAEYLSNSTNAAKLSKTEKELLRKLLKLYRNLNFFPDSMENTPVEDWQIIPVALVEKKSSGFVDALDEDENIIKPNINKVSESKAEPKTERKEPNQLDELEHSLSQYSPGTLEHKAVTQEIGRLNKKTKK